MSATPDPSTAPGDGSTPASASPSPDDGSTPASTATDSAATAVSAIAASAAADTPATPSTPASPPDPIAAAAAATLAVLLEIAGDDENETEDRLAACRMITEFCNDTTLHNLVDSVPPLPSAGC